MKYDRFMIAPFKSGLMTNTKPWLLPEDACDELENAYVRNGEIRKRFGASVLNQDKAKEFQHLYTRLRISIGTLNAQGNIGDAHVDGGPLRAGQQFSIANDATHVVFTLIDDGGGGLLAVSTNPAYICNVDGNNVTIASHPLFAGSSVYFYPCDPVMGFAEYKRGDINSNPVYAFDTQFAYHRNLGGWERLGAGANLWTGNNSHYIWPCSWHGDTDDVDILFITNNNPEDRFRYYYDVTNTWTSFTPVVNTNSGTYMYTAKILIVFNGLLVALDTVEGVSEANAVRFVNRMRCTWPLQSPINVHAWDEYVPGRGFRYDAPTKESIVTATIIRNRLIVYFEKSTYELVATNNEVIPLIWQKLNSELGCQAPFSYINFDDAVLAVGATGIHSCNGQSVARIDGNINGELPRIFSQQAQFARTYGIRDIETEMIYWSFVDGNLVTDYNNQFPNKILAYNYENGSWAYFNDSVTAFGYQPARTGRTWSEMTELWGSTARLWQNANLQSAPRRLIAGNQKGYTFLVDNNKGKNSPSLTIEYFNIAGNPYAIFCRNHNLQHGSYVLIEGCIGKEGFNDRIYRVIVTGRDTIELEPRPDDGDLTPAYLGNGTMTLVSKPLIKTKQFNFYVRDNRKMHINRIDMLVERSDNAVMTVQCFPSFTTIDLITEGRATGSALGTQVISLSPYTLAPLESYANQYWRTIYINAIGQTIQIAVTLSEGQMLEKASAFSPFALEAILFVCRPLSTDMAIF